MQTQTQTQAQAQVIVNNDLVKAAMAKSTKKGTMQGLDTSSIITIIESKKTQIAQALPKHIKAERIIQIATSYIRNDPRIAECEATSILGAVMQASIIGLEPIPSLGLVYFVPYARNVGTKDNKVWKKEVQFQIGYKGYIKLAYNSKEIKMIYADVIREGDFYKCEKGLYKKLIHIPKADFSGDEKIIYSYAVVHYINGSCDFVILSRNQIENLRNRNASQKNGLSGSWLTDYESMTKGKAIRQLYKFIPSSIDIQCAIASDGAVINENSFTNNQDGIDLNRIEYVGNKMLEKPSQESIDSWTTEYDQQGGMNHA